jgi:hypothetical protein
MKSGPESVFFFANSHLVHAAGRKTMLSGCTFAAGIQLQLNGTPEYIDIRHCELSN